MSSVHVDRFQQRKDSNSEKYMQKFMESTGMIPSDKDFYVQLEAFMESQYVKENMENDTQISVPEKKKDKGGTHLAAVNEEAYVLVSQDKENFIQGVVMGGKFYVATRKELTQEYLFELLEQGTITAKQASDFSS